MVSWKIWWVFLTTNIVLDLTPGPAVMLVLASALKHGPRRTVFTTLGILSSNATYFALSASSLGALLLASYKLFFLVKWVGAAYLIYLGVRALFSRRSLLTEVGSNLAVRRSAPKLFADGFLLQVSNPKALVYFAALLPQFIDTSKPVSMQIAIFGITSIVGEFCVLNIYALVAGRSSAVAREPRFAIWTNRISGALLISAGTGIALLRRD
jgi:homoserine/homoserine lactone efflux protein